MTEAGIAVRTLRIDYFLDVICPWCWIGLRNLRTAMDSLSAEQPDTAVQIVWHANTLQPQIPTEGVSFQAFYEARLGGKEAVEARRAQVRSFAEPVGIQLNYAAIQYFPNSRLACALVNTAQSQLNTQDMLAFVESIFSAYFTQGQNIGDLQTLQSLAKAAGPALRVLHDRRIPGTRANIDHLVVCPTGVFVVDTKRYRNARPAFKVEGGLFAKKRRVLTVGGRDRSSLVAGLHKQLDLVRAALADEVDVPVGGYLCFLDADWPLFADPFSVEGVGVVWPRKLVSMLGKPGPLDAERIEDLQWQLHEAFPRQQ